MVATATKNFVGSINPVPASAKPPKMVRYSHVAKRPFEWLWPDRIALGKLTFLVGEPGLGKGLLAVDLAARVSRGACWPGASEARAPLGTAILLHAEDDQYDTMPERLEAAGADLDKILTFEMEADGEGSQIPRPFSLRDDLGALEAALAATPDCRLVVIDPISAYLGSADGNHNHEVRSLLHSLSELARIYRVAIVVVAHLNKRPSAKSINRVMGALSFVSTARTVWGVMRDPADANQRLFLTLKSNVSEDNQGLRFRLQKPAGMPVPRVEWSAEAVSMSFDSVSAPTARFNVAEQKYRDEENYVTVRLQQELSGGPQKQRWLELMIPGTDGLRYRAADRLGVLKMKEEYHWTWMLPEHFPEWQRKTEKRQREQARERRERKKLLAREARGAKGSTDPDDTTAELEALRRRLELEAEWNAYDPGQESWAELAAEEDAASKGHKFQPKNRLPKSLIPGIAGGRETEWLQRELQRGIAAIVSQAETKPGNTKPAATSPSPRSAIDPATEQPSSDKLQQWMQSLPPQERQTALSITKLLRDGLKQTLTKPDKQAPSPNRENKPEESHREEVQCSHQSN